METELDWEALFHQWAVARETFEPSMQPARGVLEKRARKLLQRKPVPDLEWLLAVLEGTTKEDQRKRYFLCSALSHTGQVPPLLFLPMLRAAVYERNPSLNRWFIEPCLRWAGLRRVNEVFVHYLETGTNAEKAGAASAFYWSMARNPRVRDEDIRDLGARIRCRFLTEFVANEDVDVRRRILPGLLLDPEYYPEELHPLIPQAIQIARSHSDPYIRHRIEIQLGGSGPFMPIPG